MGQPVVPTSRSLLWDSRFLQMGFMWNYLLIHSALMPNSLGLPSQVRQLVAFGINSEYLMPLSSSPVPRAGPKKLQGFKQDLPQPMTTRWLASCRHQTCWRLSKISGRDKKGGSGPWFYFRDLSPACSPHHFLLHLQKQLTKTAKISRLNLHLSEGPGEPTYIYQRKS